MMRSPAMFVRRAGSPRSGARRWAPSACGDVARTGRSPAFLIIDSLEGASGAEPDAFGDVLSRTS